MTVTAISKSDMDYLIHGVPGTIIRPATKMTYKEATELANDLKESEALENDPWSYEVHPADGMFIVVLFDENDELVGSWTKL